MTKSRPLGETQKGIIRCLREYGPWYPGCGWAWGYVTERVCEALVKRGLVVKVDREVVNRTKFKYVLTEAGNAVLNDVIIKRKLGYAATVEKNAIRHQLEEAGHTDPLSLYMATEDAYVEAHKNDPSLRERQESKKEEAESKVESNASNILTNDELSYLVAHFELANDPLAISIGEKARKLLEKSA